MTNFLVQRTVENAVREMFDDKFVRIAESLGRLAAKQGGGSAIQNYQLLGKRALIVLGVAVVVVQVTTSVISRKREEQRIERVVHRVLEEERQKEKAEA